MVDTTIVHFEIPAENLEKLKSFYEKALGWKIINAPVGDMDYWVIRTIPTDDKGMPMKQGVNGGMYKKTDKSQVPVNYISVDDIDVALKKVIEQGGKVMMDKQKLPSVGTFAICLDPEGNPFGFIQVEM